MSEEVALKYLLRKIKSKGKEIDLGSELKCQKYLLPNRILTWEEQVQIFSYKSRLNELKYNFAGEDPSICGIRLDNEHLMKWEILCEGKPSNQEYSLIFNGSIKQQKDIMQTLNRNMKTLKKFTLAQDTPWADSCISM